MMGAGTDPNNQGSYVAKSNAVDTFQVLYVILLEGFLVEFLGFGMAKGVESLVSEMQNLFTFVVIANPAFKSDHGSAAVILQVF